MTFNRIKTTLHLAMLICLSMFFGGCMERNPDTMLPYGIDVAPNGNIVFVGKGYGGIDLYILDPKSGKVNALTSSDDCELDPSFDRTGSRVVYSASKTSLGDYHIMVMPASGGKPIQLTTGAGSDFGPRFSRDGKKITFSRSNGSHPYSMGGANKIDSFDIYVMNSDGTNLRRLTHGKYYEAGCPDFCDSDTKVLFYTWDGKPGYRLYAVDLTATSAPSFIVRQGYQTSCSPDGKSAVFSSDKAVPFREEVHTMNLASRKERQITYLKSSVTCPRFTANGKQIVFLADLYDLPDLWIVNADGTNIRKIAENSLFLKPLAWKKGMP